MDLGDLPEMPIAAWPSAASFDSAFGSAFGLPAGSVEPAPQPDQLDVRLVVSAAVAV